MSREVDERVAALEAELAFQGETVDSLSEALARQQQDLLLVQRQVTLLGEELRKLRERSAGGGSDTGQDPVSEKPPHY